MTRRRVRDDLVRIFGNQGNKVWGVCVPMTWASLEIGDGWYWFEPVYEWLDFCTRYGKELFIHFIDRSFAADEITTPEYIEVVQTVNGGWCPKLWESQTMRRSNKVIRKLGEVFDTHPHFAGVKFMESIIRPANQGGEANQYNDWIYSAMMRWRLASAAGHMPNSTVIQNMNWGSSVVLDVINDFEDLIVGLGCPDLVPDEGRFPDKARMPVYDYYPNYKGLIPLSCDVQTPDLHIKNTKGVFTLDNFWQMATATLDLDMLFWAFVEEPWFKFKFIEDILPYINEKA